MEKCDCADCRGEDRVYEPLRLRCKDVELAKAFCLIVTRMGAGLRTPDGSVMEPYVEDEVVVVMPWGGGRNFASSMAYNAMMMGVADQEEARQMQYRAMAQDFDTDVENVQEFGEAVSEAVERLMASAGSKRPPDVSGIMSTFDQEIADLHRQQGD